MKHTALITDGHWRKSLAAVRALGREGISVTVGETTRLNTSAFSRYCRRALVYPSPRTMPSEFMDAVKTEVSRHSCRLLLAMEDDTLALLTQHHDEISKAVYFPAVSHEKLIIAQDKAHVLKLAEAHGIPFPRTWILEDLSQLDDILERLPFPVVIKPRTGSGAVGVTYPKTPDLIKLQYLSTHKRFPLPMIQEMIPREGTGFGASFLMDEQGRVNASFVHKRLREYPVTGGASTLRESVKHDDIREMALTLLKAMDWFGVAMVEFKLDPRDGIPKLMEINPRFWGSLSLAIESGVNFPHILYQMSRGKRVTPVEHYEIGKKCRWLLPGDLLHFIHNPERWRLVPNFFNFLDKHTAYDILSIRDPLPVIGRILTPLTFLYDRDMQHRLKKRRK